MYGDGSIHLSHFLQTSFELSSWICHDCETNVNPPQQNFHLDNDNKNIYKNLLKSITAVYVYLGNFVQSTFPLVNNITHYSSIIFIFGEIKWMDETRYRHHTKCTASQQVLHSFRAVQKSKTLSVYRKHLKRR